MSDAGRTERWVLRAIMALGAVCAVALAVGLSQSWSSESSFTERAQGDSLVGMELYDASERTPLPELSGRDLDGENLSTSDFEGQVLILNVWGSWCGPCREEAPDLVEVDRATAEQPVHFLGINTRDNVSAAKAYERRYEIGYPSFDDQGGEVLLELGGLVPLNAVPSTIFVDTRGRVAARVIGPVDASTLEGVIADLLAEDPEAAP